MEKQTYKKRHGREELKKFFRNGTVPSENHFAVLIESMINKEDDGFEKDKDNGMHLSAMGADKTMITFYKTIDEHEPFFYVDLHDQSDAAGLRLHAAKKPPHITEEENSFYFQEGGMLGIGKEADQPFKLDVNGWAGMQGRMGTYRPIAGNAFANGKWHPIISDLNNCQAFEIVARVGKTRSGKFAIMHAIALSAFGKSSSRIRKTCAHYGFFWNRLNLRWHATDTKKYELQIKTNRNFGDNVIINYSITKLWDDTDAGLPGEYFYPDRQQY